MIHEAQSIVAKGYGVQVCDPYHAIGALRKKSPATVLQPGQLKFIYFREN